MLAYHDAEWGFSSRRRHPAVREDLPRGFSVRTELAHHPQQAGQLPEGVRGLRLPRARAVRRARRGAPSATPASSATAARSRRLSTTRAAPFRCRPTRDRSPPISGGSNQGRGDRYPAVQSAIGNVGRAVEGPAQTGAGSSSGRPPRSPSCSRWAWSTTTSTSASPALPSNRRGGRSPTELTSGSGPRSAHRKRLTRPVAPLISSTRLLGTPKMFGE